IQQVQHIANGAGGFTINTPTATAVVRGTRYTVTVRCYTSQPGVPTTALLSFPRRVSESSYVLADEALYVDGNMLWETRSWADPDTGQTFQTHDPLGQAYPETGATAYQEDDGSYWLDRTWEDPTTGATWHTYEDLGQPANEQAGSTGQSAMAAQAGCASVTSVVVVDGRVNLTPATPELTALAVGDGQAGGASGEADADAGLTPQGLQAFDQASFNLRDLTAAQNAARLANQVTERLAQTVLRPPPTTGMSGASGLVGSVTLRSATAASGLGGQNSAPPAAPTTLPSGATAPSSTPGAAPTASSPTPTATPPASPTAMPRRGTSSGSRQAAAAAGGSSGPPPSDTPTPPPSSTSTPTAASLSATPTPAPPTATSTPSATPLPPSPTQTPSRTPVPTSTGTPRPPPSPTATPTCVAQSGSGSNVTHAGSSGVCASSG
ncbi:MAG: hypothetical protein JO023_25625, partial [Chloroflexi bacterium]|nr:hypothetical protein [Chloroflexota bacterium]